ncbi:hypothetical protein HT031_002681 [Scenedesmus sp. PABB004]|nr:hypothetical protein HT031_002681 [Scenedesmus sp. PABB004]
MGVADGWRERCCCATDKDSQASRSERGAASPPLPSTPRCAAQSLPPRPAPPADGHGAAPSAALKESALLAHLRGAAADGRAADGGGADGAASDGRAADGDADAAANGRAAAHGDGAQLHAEFNVLELEVQLLRAMAATEVTELRTQVTALMVRMAEQQAELLELRSFKESVQHALACVSRSDD